MGANGRRKRKNRRLLPEICGIVSGPGAFARIHRHGPANFRISRPELLGCLSRHSRLELRALRRDRGSRQALRDPAGGSRFGGAPRTRRPGGQPGACSPDLQSLMSPADRISFRSKEPLKMRRILSTLLLAACIVSAQTKKIVYLNGDAATAQEFQAMSPNVKIVPVPADRIMSEIGDADALIGIPTPEMIKAGRNLKWVQVMSAGVENVLFRPGSEAIRNSNIILTNNKIVQGPEIADHAFAMLLFTSRQLNVFYKNKQEENWQPRPFRGIELRGKTAVIIGVGGIGTQIALRAYGFGMNVIGVDPEDKPFVPYVSRFVKPDQLDEVIPEADVVFISAPDTAKSHKMMGMREFDLMKQNSFFICVSRGGLYDMNGLVKALDSKKLMGAGVDVTDPEPLPKGHPLWKFDNVMITPHIAGRSDKDNARMIGTIKENIRRFGAGLPLINVVDKQKGY